MNAVINGLDVKVGFAPSETASYHSLYLLIDGAWVDTLINQVARIDGIPVWEVVRCGAEIVFNETGYELYSL